MKHLLRNTTAAALAGFALAGCGTTGTPAVTPAQVAADLSGLVTTLTTVIPQIERAAPGALTPSQQTALANDLQNARIALAGFTAGIPASVGASKAQIIDGYIADVLSTAVAVAPPPYNTALIAAEVILPEVEMFINQYLPASITQPAAARFASARVGAAAMTPDQARAKLGIPIVHAP